MQWTGLDSETQENTDTNKCSISVMHEQVIHQRFSISTCFLLRCTYHENCSRIYVNISTEKQNERGRGLLTSNKNHPHRRLAHFMFSDNSEAQATSELRRSRKILHSKLIIENKANITSNQKIVSSAQQHFDGIVSP